MLRLAVGGGIRAGTEVLERQLQLQQSEGGAVVGGQADLPHGSPMAPGGVAHVALPPVLRVAGGQARHQAVAADLGHDRRAGNRVDERVAAHHRLVLPGEAAHRQPVDDNVIRVNGQAREGPAHGAGGGLEDVVAVDLPHRCRPERDGSGPRVDLARDFGTSLRGQGLGVGGSFDEHPFGEDDGSRDNRSRDGAPADFVHAGHINKIASPEPAFVLEDVVWAGCGGHLRPMSAVRGQVRASAAGTSAFP